MYASEKTQGIWGELGHKGPKISSCLVTRKPPWASLEEQFGF